MRRLLTVLLSLTVALAGTITTGAQALAACTSTGLPVAVTDQSDYAPGNTVVITLKGLDCGAAYTVAIQRPDGTSVISTVTGSDNGDATVRYLFGAEAGIFFVWVDDSAGVQVASTEFHGSHFRYGHLTWRPVGPRLAEFSVINAFRRGYSGTGPDGLVVTGDTFEETIGGTTLCFGDGSCTNTLRYEVLTYDVAQNWVLARAVQGGGATALPGTGVTVNESEPNDAIAGANSAALGDDFWGSTSGCGPTDFVRFTVPTAQTISLTIVPQGLGDSLLWLFNAGGTQLAFNDDFFGLASHIEQAVAPGTYYAAIGGYSCQSGGYTLQIRGTTVVAPGAISHQYSGNGPVTAFIDSCCRIGSLSNSSGSSYRVASTVRFDVVDSSPVSSLPPIVNAPVNTAGFTFLVPAVDAEGDALTFRLASSSESRASSIPGLSVNATTGVVTWSTVGTSIGQLWTQQIVIEERRGGLLIGQSAVDFIIRIVGAVGNAPTCQFTPNQTAYTVGAGSPISFTVTGTDPDPGDTLQMNSGGLPSGATMTPTLPRTGSSPLTSTFNWTPAASTTNSAYAVSFTISDQNGLAAQCAVTINVTARPTNRPPVANAGAAQTVNEGSTVTLDGSASSDPDGNTLTYAWQVISATGPAISLSSATAVAPTFSATDNGVYVLRLTVDDGHGATSSADVRVTVLNVAPTATATNDGPNYWGVAIAFTGSATDPSTADTAAGFTGAWTFGDSASAAGMTAAHAYATPATYTASFTATDKDGGLSAPATTRVVVNKRPTALSCADTNATFGFPVAFTSSLTDTFANLTISGATISYTVDGTAQSGTTSPPLAMPGTHSVRATFSDNSLYTGSTANCVLTVVNTSAGKVTGGGMRTANNGRGGFNAQSDTTGLKGDMQFQNDTISYHAQTITALGISADKTKAWFAGTATNGTTFVAYVEDNGEPGATDLWKIWVAGASQNGDGQLTGGNIQIH